MNATGYSDIDEDDAEDGVDELYEEYKASNMTLATFIEKLNELRASLLLGE